MTAANPFDIVVVCTGNRFRSPIVEQLLRRSVDGLPVRVRSFGQLDLRAIPVLPEALEEARRFGLDLSAHRANALAGVDLSGVDLVIGFERAHIAHAVIAANAPLERTFTLPELVQVLERLPAVPRSGDVPATARATVAAAAAERPSDPRQAKLPEVADPLGRPRRVAERVADDLRDLTERLVLRLFGRR
jgi:protein-tyrosine phosphatase